MIKTPFWPVPLGAKPIDLGLERIRKLLRCLKIEEKKLPPVIHVAGTNGKGSTIAFLRAFLEEAGYSVHVYTSPHLIHFNERIVLAGKIISDDFLNEVLGSCKKTAEGIPVTFFEGTTAAAFLAFSRVPADILLLETGMGGRLDATNVIEKPLLTIITPISLDHMEFLGDTIEKIAAEKAAIIKSSVPCIAGQQQPEAAEVIEAAAKKKGAELYKYGYNWHVEKSKTGFKYISNSLQLDLPIPSLPGDHQLQNAGVAIAALTKIPEFTVDANHIRAGLQSVNWPARLQRLSLPSLPKNYSLWLDGGHNRAGGEILANWLKSRQEEKIYIICGMLKEKETKAFLENFLGLVEKIYAVAIWDEEKSQSAAEITGTARSIGIESTSAESVATAIQEISGLTTAPALILICGSLYLAGNVLENEAVNIS